MYLTGLTHRDHLFEVASRWLCDRIEDEDGLLVSQIFTFECMATAPSVRRLTGDLVRAIEPGPLGFERVLTKDPVRRAIAAWSEHVSPRARELVEHYREAPEEFFPRTPVYMSLVTSQQGRLLAMIRRKRIRRIAEKVSRTLADRLADAIDEVAEGLASDRARTAGVPLDKLVSSDQVMAEEFASAERIVADRFRTGEVTIARGDQRVDDVIGVKIIGTDDELARVEATLQRRSGTVVIEREVRTGNYSGTHFLVELQLPPEAEVMRRMENADWSIAADRGLELAELPRLFAAYVAEGRRQVTVELILTTFDDLVESELGSSIHEARILEQRQGRRYAGRIARNASYIVEFLLRLAVSPTVSVEGLPIKMWGRYLPDTLGRAVATLAADERPDWLRAPDVSL
jgi:hypothetical protein